MKPEKRFEVYVKMFWKCSKDVLSTSRMVMVVGEPINGCGICTEDFFTQFLIVVLILILCRGGICAVGSGKIASQHKYDIYGSYDSQIHFQLLHGIYLILASLLFELMLDSGSSR